MLHVVVIGGGTGTSIVLEALRRLGLEPTAIVPTSDSGGSSGRLREERGIIPVGDIRQCLLTLGNFSADERALWNSRFTSGWLDGHALGNIIIARLLESAASVDEALECVRRIWKLHGSIIPMTRRPTTLCVRYRDGAIICDEHSIDEPKKLHSGIVSLSLQRKDPAHPAAVRALGAAQFIVLAPGDLYTSLLPVLLPAGMTQAIARSKARIVLVANLMTKHGQTDGFTLGSLVTVVDTYLAPRSVDLVLVNSSPLPQSALARYTRLAEMPIPLDPEHSAIISKKLTLCPLVAPGSSKSPVRGDRLRRSLLRHDPEKLARALQPLLSEPSNAVQDKLCRRRFLR